MGLLAASDPDPVGPVAVAGRLVDPAVWAQWRAALVTAVDDHDRAHPLDLGLAPVAARRAIGLPGPGLLDALVTGTPTLVATAGRVGRRGSRPAFPPGAQAALETLRARLTADPFAAPEQPELDALGLATPVLATAAKAGLLLRLASGVVLLPEAKAEAVCRLRALSQPFTLSQARQVLGHHASGCRTAAGAPGRGRTDPPAGWGVPIHRRVGLR